MNHRVLLATGTWAMAAAVAIGAGVAAIGVLGEGITDRTVSPLNSTQVQQALAQPYSTPYSTPSTETPEPSTAPSPSAKHPNRSSATRRAAAPATSATPSTTGTAGVSTQAGSAIVRCERGLAYLVAWTPAQGYSTGTVLRGPAPEIFVRFVSAHASFNMAIACRGNKPVLDPRFTGGWPPGHVKHGTDNQG